MHAIELIDLAATFVRHAEAQVALRTNLSKEAMHGFWLTCRYRHDGWSARLAAHRAAIQKEGASERNRLWYEILPVLQEILLSEPLTRCVAHQAVVLEEAGIELDFAALAQSALSAHVEARHRCLHLIVFGNGLSTNMAVRLNRLRRISEQYTDQLLAALRSTQKSDVCSFDALATSAIRAKMQSSGSWDTCCRLHTAGLAHWYIRTSALDLDYRKGDARQNSRLAQTVLGLLPETMFDGFGVPISHHFSSFLRDSDSESSQKSQAAMSGSLNSPLDLIASGRHIPSVPSSARRW